MKQYLIKVHCTVEKCIFHDKSNNSCQKDEIEIDPRNVTINYPVSTCKSFKKNE